MLSVHTSCLETQAFIFGKCHLLSYFQGEKERGVKKEKEEDTGGERRSASSDANVPNQVEFRKITWKSHTLIHKAPITEKQIRNLTLEIN